MAYCSKGGEKIVNLQDVQRSDHEFFRVFFMKMLDYGVHLAPSCYEAGFVSSAHTKSVVDATVEIADRVCRELRA